MKSHCHNLFLKFVAAAIFALSGTVMLHAADNVFDSLSNDDFKSLKADHWRVAGKNIIVSGNVYLPFGNFELFADKMVINLENRDFEAVGNVRLYQWQNMSTSADLQKLQQLQQRNNVLIREITPVADVFGNRSYDVKMVVQMDNMQANRLTGNLNSSYFKFEHATLSYKSFTCHAESGEHLPSGETLIHKGEISSCNYLHSDNAHYSISGTNIRLLAHKARFYGISNADFDKGDRTILMTNNFVKIYGIPVLWLPLIYKPKDESLGICTFVWGKSTHWGYYINLSRKIVFSEYPDFSAKLLLDWYSQRGVGYGITARAVTEESRTDFFAYSIFDRDRYETDYYNKYRLKVPHARFAFKLSNVTHITPRLDFRGNFFYSRDRYFLRDFFPGDYVQNPQPSNFMALEQQFDNLSAAAYLRLRLNDYFSVAEKLPEFRLSAQRQEIFNTGLYYQGDMTATNFRMRWIEFDRHPVGRYNRLKDYHTFRMDTTHFLYYPIRNRFFTLTPRAGFKLTAYSNTSKREVSDKNLQALFNAANPQSNGKHYLVNYDKKGGSKVRVVAELGMELSTKIHGTWQDVRSGFFEIDGLRHVMQPYLNYTYITNPNVARQHLYYFDEVDRIDEQNFLRIGVVNRLQTRNKSGNGLDELMYLENFWDIYARRKDDMSQLGNFGTILQLKLFKGLTLNTQFLIDISSDREIDDTYRRGRNAGKTGLALKWLNEWKINLNYAPATNWNFQIGYNYLRPYYTRSTYSMGSTLTQINATSSFARYYNEVDECFFFAAKFPITPDHRTLGNFSITYDVAEGGLDVISLSVLRQFHCWQLMASVEFEHDFDDKEWDVNYSIHANLTGLTPANTVVNKVLRGIGNSDNSLF